MANDTNETAAAIPSDGQLLDQFLSTGNQSYFTQLYDRHYKILRDFLRHRGLSACDADEQAHEAMSVVATKLDQYDRSKPLGPYLFTIATNALVDNVRAAKRQKMTHLTDLVPEVESRHGEAEYDPLDFREAAPEDAAATSEYVQKIRASLGSLEPKYQEVLRTRYFDGLSDEEASAKLDVPLGTYKARIKRARRMLGIRISRTTDHRLGDMVA